MAKAKPKTKPKSRRPASMREYHEGFTIWNLKESLRLLPGAYSQNCGHALENVIEVSRRVAAARAHLTSLGDKEGPRARKLWGIVGKREKQVRAGINSLVRSCLERTSR